MRTGTVNKITNGFNELSYKAFTIDGLTKKTKISSSVISSFVDLLISLGIVTKQNGIYTKNRGIEEKDIMTIISKV